MRRVAILAGLGLLLLGAPQARAQTAPPNLLILAIDTLRADRLGCYGHTRATSPAIDALATEGVRFARAVSTSPWTLPSFATMLTGRHPTRHGAGLDGTLRNLSEDLPRILSPTVPTLAETLAAAGYRTAAVTSNPYLLFGLQRGFETFLCRSMPAQRVGLLARTWLDARGDEPFFLFCHFNDPHEPTDTADPYLKALGVGRDVLDDPHRQDLERWGSRDDGTYLGTQPSAAAAEDLLRTKLALYDGAILQVDREVARIVELLERDGLLENTLVVVVSDHGEEFLEHAEAGRELSADPRGVWGIGHGHSLYEELLWVPLILRGLGLDPAVIEQQFSLVDLMPTLLGMLGMKAPALGALDGSDRTGWMRDPARSPLPAFSESTAYGLDLIGFSDGRHKFVGERAGLTQWAFDLTADPREHTDLASQPALQSLAEQARAWAEALVEQAPPPTDPAQLSESMREGLQSLGYIQ